MSERSIAVLLTFVAAVGVARPSAAQRGTFRYRVQPGDSCASIARRLYGSSRDYERIHELNPDLGPPPHRLEPGTVLILPRPPDDGPDARVTGAQNVVRARPPGGRFAPASVGDELSRGAQVETGARSSAELTFRDRSTVQMREETLVIIYGGSGSLAQRRSTATLERGALRSRLAELTGRFSVDTPSGTARVVGGDAIVAVDDDGSSRLANHEGRPATVTAGNVSVRVPAGSGTRVRRGERPAPPRPLPAAPRWRVDQPGRFVGLTGRGGTIGGAFEPVEGAVAYRVEVARRPDGTDVAAAVEITAPTTEFAIHRMPAGVYYVSIATIDEWLLEGLPSPRRAVQVLEARVIPPGGGEPLVEPYDPGDPSVPDRLPRVLPGTWIVAPVGFKCGPHGGSAAEMSTLLGDGRTVVQCFDPGGREVPAFDVVLSAPRARVEEATAELVRRVPSRVVVHLESELSIPNDLLAWSPEGVEVGRVTRRPDGAFEVPLTATTDAPSEIPVTLGVAEGDERVALAHFFATVRDSSTSPRPSHPTPSAPTRTYEVAPGLFTHLALPEVVPISPAGRAGATFHAAIGGITADASSGGIRDTVRGNFGARARLFDQPLEIGFDWTIDASGEYTSEARRGAADLRVFANLTYPASSDFALTTDLTAWIPTGATDGSLGDVRLIPSVSLSGSFSRPLWLRTRQGFVVDTSGDTQLWSSAYGTDVRLLEALELGIEAQLVVGRSYGEDRLAAALAFQAALPLGPAEGLLGLRIGFGPDGESVFGRFAALGALRFILDAP
jgi:hypothetical protein